MEWLLVAMALALGYLFSKSQNASNQIGTQQVAPPSATAQLPGGATITIAGGVMPGVSGSGIPTAGIVSASGSALTASLQATKTLTGAIPIIGTAVGVVSGIISAITAHHQQALAAEGKALNDADPRAIQALALVVQGVANGSIPSVSAAQAYCDQIVNDWYGEVKNIQRGMWHYTLSPSQDPSLISADPTPGIMNWFDYNAPGDVRPDPCNAACVVGHYFIERDRAIAMIHVNRILAGQHGVCIFPALPAHDTQLGYSQVAITY